MGKPHNQQAIRRKHACAGPVQNRGLRVQSVARNLLAAGKINRERLYLCHNPAPDIANAGKVKRRRGQKEFAFNMLRLVRRQRGKIRKPDDKKNPQSDT